MDTVTDRSFTDRLIKLALLEPDQLEALPELLKEYPHVGVLAQELLRREWLTPYQVNRLFQGRGDELTLGNHILLNKVGEGGMGQVFKARHRHTGRIAALKVLRRECLGNERMVKRFRREIEIAGQVDHPHIVRAYDAGEIDGQAFIVMEYVEGTDLAHLVKRQGPLAIAQACEYARQAALGLQHAMEAGLVHRDIKPANLLVTRAEPRANTRQARRGEPPASSSPWGLVKILDLGLARWTRLHGPQLTALGSVMGTPDFLAPEQANDPRRCDIRADLYSLGCSLYYLIAGRMPFPRGSATEKILQHQTEEAPPMAMVRCGRFTKADAKKGQRWGDRHSAVPAEVEAIVRRLMAKRPADRFQTPAELVDALASLQDLEGDPATAPDPLGRIPTNRAGAKARRDLGKTHSGGAKWNAMSEPSLSRPIVRVRVPVNEPAPWRRWAIVAGVAAVILTSFLYVQGGRGQRPQAAPPVAKGP